MPSAPQGGGIAVRDDLVAAYHRRLTGDDPEALAVATRAWSTWEGVPSHLLRDQAAIDEFSENEAARAVARIECHYFVNGGFFERPDQLLEEVDRIHRIPAVIVQGRYDVVRPMATAWDLHRRWPEARFEVVPDAGHSALEQGITACLVAATGELRGS